MITMEIRFDKKYIMSKFAYLVEKDNKMLIANSSNGMWVVVPKVNYDIMMDGLKKERLQEYLDEFSEQERTYLINFYNELIRMELLSEKNDDEVNKIKYKVVTISITNTCNLQCRHCCQNATLSVGKIDIEYECIISRFDKILKLNPDMICITGGEPMVRKDFFGLATYFRKNFEGKLILMTNGTFINNENVELIIQLFDSIDISIDGVDEVSCSVIRGKNVFSKVIESIKLIKMRGDIPISLSMVLTKENQKLKKQFATLNRELGTKPVLRPLAHSGRADENSTLFPKEIEKYHMVQNNSNQLSDIRKEKRCRTCLAARKSVYIDSDGSIFPCGALNKEKYCLGHLDQLNNEEIKNFENVIIDSKGYDNFLQIHPERQDRCKDCSVRLFCYNCIERYDVDRNSAYFDDFCKNNKDLLEKVVWGDV